MVIHTLIDMIYLTEFLGWLIEICIQSIYPGACFQRCKTALDWLDIILDSMTYQPHRKQNKGKTPGKNARTQGFFQIKFV